MHAGGQGLLDHPGIGAHGVGRAGNGQRDDDGRGLVTGAGRTGVDQAAHEVAQLLEVERPVLHFIRDVVGLGGRHLLAFFVAAAADLRVIDGLVLEPHVDDAVDVLAGAGGLLSAFPAMAAFTGDTGCWALTDIAVSTAAMLAASRMVLVFIEISPVNCWFVLVGCSE